MKTVKIFVNESAIAQAIAEINSLVNHAENVAKILSEFGVSCEHATSVMAGDMSSARQAYIDCEIEKLTPTIALLGDGSFLVDLAREKITADADKLVEKIKAKVNPIDWRRHAYLPYLAYNNGKWERKSNYIDEITESQSIILSDPKDIAQYNEIKQLIDGLNKLTNGSNLLARIGSVGRYNATENEFSINYKVFDKKNILPSYF